MTRLPIDVVLGTDPPRFQWQQTVNTMYETVTQDCEGRLPPSVECAVADLIYIAKQLSVENAALKKRLEGALEVVSAQGKREDQRQREGQQRVAAAEPIKKK